MGQLAAGIAHDFNNLLMVISGYSGLMVNKLSAADPLRKNGEQILKAARRAGALTGQLLAFSRKQVQALRVLDLSAVLEEIGKILPGVLGDKIQVPIVPNQQLWPVKADPAQIEQILMNLATNARDAMPQGGQLMIETANVEFDEEYTRSHIAAPAGEYVMLAISDTGTGIDRTVVPRVFEPFFTTKRTGKRDRARALHGVRDRQAEWGICVGVQRGGLGYYLQSLPSSREQRTSGGRSLQLTRGALARK